MHVFGDTGGGGLMNGFQTGFGMKEFDQTKGLADILGQILGQRMASTGAGQLYNGFTNNLSGIGTGQSSMQEMGPSVIGQLIRALVFKGAGGAAGAAGAAGSLPLK